MTEKLYRVSANNRIKMPKGHAGEYYSLTAEPDGAFTFRPAGKQQQASEPKEPQSFLEKAGAATKDFLFNPERNNGKREQFDGPSAVMRFGGMRFGELEGPRFEELKVPRFEGPKF